MAAWLRKYEVTVTFLTSLVFGLVMICAAAFTVGATIGLLTTGVLSIVAGHWVTYLKTAGRLW